MSVELASREDVKTSDKRSLREVDWIIRLLENNASSKPVDAGGPIGLLSHSPERASSYEYDSEGCQADVALDHDTFASLLEATQAGRMPDWLTIKVKGLDYGMDPDGRDKVWDVASHAIVPIVEISVRVPIVVAIRPESDSPDTDEGKTNNLPATASDIRSLRDKLISTYTDHQRSSRQLLAALVVLVFALLLVVYFK
jgi:hypothetical protein